MITLELERSEVEMLIGALGKFPLEQVLGLWQKIQIQAAAQSAENPPSVDPTPE